jgi:serine/threonine protein kinase
MGVVAGSRFGPYEIVSPLGAGGMGEVYRARDTRLGREVALKILPASFADDKTRLNRFRQEACAAGALNHPNILVIYDVGADDSAPYVVSELLEGETLRQRMAGAALPQRKAIDYSQQIAFGLAAAHDKGIVHRDLKPENLFITKDGRLKTIAICPSRLMKNGLRRLSGMPKPAPATFGSSIRREQLRHALLSMVRKIFCRFGLLMVRRSFLSLTAAALAIFMKSLQVELQMRKRYSRLMKGNGRAIGPKMGNMSPIRVSVRRQSWIYGCCLCSEIENRFPFCKRPSMRMVPGFRPTAISSLTILMTPGLMKFMSSRSRRQVLNGKSLQAEGCNRVGAAMAKSSFSLIPKEI